VWSHILEQVYIFMTSLYNAILKVYMARLASIKQCRVLVNLQSFTQLIKIRSTIVG